MVPQNSAVIGGMPPFLVILAMETLVAPQGTSTHFVRPFEVWLILDLLQNLMHRLPEHDVNHLKNYRPRLPDKIPSRSVTVVAIRPEIPPFLEDNLTLSLAFLFILLNSLVFINLVHELAYTSNGFPSQRLP